MWLPRQRSPHYSAIAVNVRSRGSLSGPLCPEYRAPGRGGSPNGGPPAARPTGLFQRAPAKPGGAEYRSPRAGGPLGPALFARCRRPGFLVFERLQINRRQGAIAKLNVL